MKMAVEFEPMIGRYFTLNIGGDPCRIYMEESGSGIPLLCLHTAGSDSRQFRHILSNPSITSRFRVITFDLPWHGKSIWRGQGTMLCQCGRAVHTPILPSLQNVLPHGLNILL